MPDTLPLRHILLALLLMATLAAALIPSREAHAYGGPGPDQATQVALEAPQQGEGDLEGESELPWLFAVFFITWAVFFGYVFVMSRRQREMQREIEALRSALAEKERQSTRAE